MSLLKEGVSRVRQVVTKAVYLAKGHRIVAKADGAGNVDPFWQRDDGTESNLTLGGVGGNAPADAQYVTLALDGDLEAERVLTAGEGIDLADGGANSTITVTVDLSEISAGGELAGTMEAPTVDATHAGTPHTDYSRVDGTVPYTGVVGGILPTDASHLATKEYVDSATTFIGEYFFNDTASSYAGIFYKMLDTHTGEAEATFVSGSLGEADDQALVNFATDAGIPGLTVLDAGIYTGHIYAKVDASNKRPVKLHYEIYSKLEDSPFTETLITTSEESDFLTDSQDHYDIHAVLASDATIGATDRLVIKWLANVDSTPANNVTVTLYVEGDNHSRLSVPISSEVLQQIFLRQDGTLAGSVSQAQDFGSNGIKTDAIVESTGSAGVTIGSSGSGVEFWTNAGKALLTSEGATGGDIHLRRHRPGPASISNGDVFGAFLFDGYDSDGPGYYGGASVVAAATENWSGGAMGNHGTQIRISTVATGGFSSTVRWVFDQNGALTAQAAYALSTAGGALGCGELTLADGASLNLQEAITFTGATTENLIEIPDTLANALTITEGANAYMTFVTSNGSEAVNILKATAITGALTATSYGGITEANLVDKAAAEAITGAWDFGGATSLEIPNADAPTVNAAGEIALDTLIANYDDMITFYDSDGQQQFVISLLAANLTTTDNHVIVYDSGTSKFKMEAQAAAGGGGAPTISCMAQNGTPTSANGCADAVRVAVGSGATEKSYWVLDFDDGADEHVQWGPIPLPEDYDGGTMTARFAWTTTATDADGVAFGIRLLSVDDAGSAAADDISAATWGTAVVTTDDAQSNADDYLVTAVSGAITPGGTAVAPEALWVMVYRDVSDANDDMAEDARLISVKLAYSTS